MAQEREDRILMAERIVQAVTGYAVEASDQWLLLKRNLPSVSYFATDLDPRSFEFDAIEGAFVGRAELLLTARSLLRPGQAMREVSFTLPARVLLRESNGGLIVGAFDFYSAESETAAPVYVDPDDGPPKIIGWGPFEGLL
ncbi:MAG TPA: hypothetical protein VME69_04440 [Methylocella sp.]|nr:hypothetical protein [Methylocella sp.]